MRGIDADDAIGERERHVARLTRAGLRGGRRHRADALNKIVVSRLAGIRSVVAVADQADVDEPRVDFAHVVVAELEPAHRRQPDVVNQHIGALAQPQQRRARRRLFQVEDDAALVAVELKIHRAHPGVLAGAALAHQIALRRLDLDDVGAVIRQNLRGVRAQHHRRKIDNAQSLKRRLIAVVRSRCHSNPQYDFGSPKTFSAMKQRMRCGVTGAMRGIMLSRR